MDFHMRGVRLCVDCARLLKLLQGHVVGAVPNVMTICEMTANHVLAQRLYKWFKKNVFDKDNPEHLALVDDVENSNIHLLFKAEKIEDEAREEQFTYSLECIKGALRRFLDAPAVANNFCAPNAPGLDMIKAMQENKIVLLRFDPNSGPIGEDLSRYFIGQYYDAVYKVGLELPWHTFVLIDEYQDVADLTDASLSDRRFVAMAREFKSCVVLLTQSLSALGTTFGNTEVAIDSLVSNCNTRIMFYSDDPLTHEMARRYANVDLATLEPQQVFVVRYVAASRKHAHSFETVNAPYALALEMLEKGGETETPKTFGAVERVPLRDLVGNLGRKSMKKAVESKVISNSEYSE